MHINDHTKALIFDFGNVIINIDFNRTFERFKQLLGDDYENVMKQWEEKGFHQAIEKTTYTAEEMTKTLQSFGANLTTTQVKDAWNALLLDIPEERIHLLRSLRDEYELYLLSNTNYVHIEQIFGDLEKKYGENPLKPLFTKLFLSYKMGTIKPEREIYEIVLQNIPYQANECIFFDDLQENLDAAATLGFQTQLVTKEKGIVQLLGG